MSGDDTMKKTTSTGNSTAVTKEEREKTAAEFDEKIVSMFDNLKEGFRRTSRYVFTEPNPDKSKEDALNVVIQMAWTMNEILTIGTKEELYETFPSSTHVITIEAQPLSAFADKQGMTYEDFKEAYPNLTTWIEDNGWTYNEEQDKSLKGEKNNG